MTADNSLEQSQPTCEGELRARPGCPVGLLLGTLSDLQCGAWPERGGKSLHLPAKKVPVPTHATHPAGACPEEGEALPEPETLLSAHCVCGNGILECSLACIRFVSFGTQRLQCVFVFQVLHNRPAH